MAGVALPTPALSAAVAAELRPMALWLLAPLAAVHRMAQAVPAVLRGVASKRLGEQAMAGKAAVFLAALAILVLY